MRDVAAKFFDACETGAGWEACREYCHADATFVAADYVYVMDFEGERIKHMTKTWNDGFTLAQIG